MSAPGVFACFDVDHDGDLYRRLVAQAGSVGFDFTVSGSSAAFVSTDAWSERARRGIKAAARVLVICGQYTDASLGVAAELRIAREERKPYLLLWGRRDLMCTKPHGVKPADGMYTWTSSTLQEQFALMARVAQREAAAKGMRRTPKSPVSQPDRPASPPNPPPQGD